MRVKPFLLLTEVSQELLRQNPSFRAVVADVMETESLVPQRGPRGGRYQRVTVGPLHLMEQPSLRGTVEIGATFDARYVRP